MPLNELIRNDGTPFTSAAQAEQDDVVTGRSDGVITRSLRGGVYGAGSQLLSLGDAALETAGQAGASQSLRGASQSLRAKAALPQNAPRVGSLRQLREAPSLDAAGEYVGGLVGGSLPVMAAGLAGSLATGGAGAVPALLGATAATAPFETGDVVQKQQDDPGAMAAPAGARLRDAVLGGGASALLQGVVPSIVGRQILGKTAAPLVRESIGGVVKRNAMDIPLEGLTEAGGETIKQFSANQDKPLDREAILEAGVGGAAAGGAFAGLGTVGDLANQNRVVDAGRAVSSIKDRIKARVEGISPRQGAEGGEAANAPMQATMGEDLGSFFARAKEFGGDAVNRVKTGTPLGDLNEWATAQGDRLKEMTDLSDNATAQKVKEWGEQMLNDAGLTPERREQVAQAMADTRDRASQVAMAGLKEAWDAGRSMMDKARKVHEAFKRRDVDVVDVEPIKKSADYSGANRAIAEKLGPILSMTQPELAANEEAMGLISDGVRQAVEQMPEAALSADTVARLIDALGNDTAATLDAAFRAVGDPAKAEAFYARLNEVAELQASSRKLEELVAGALTETSKGMIRPDQMGEFARLLVAHARGERADKNVGPAQRAAAERHFREQMALHFGDNADAVSLAIEKAAGMGKESDGNAPGTADAEDAEARLNEDGGFGEEGERVEAEDLDEIRKGRGKNNAPVMHPDLFRSRREQGQNYAAQYMADMQKAHPDREVSFEYVEGSTTHGHVVARKAQDKDALTDKDVADMLLDTKDHSRSPDRLEVDGKIFDSRRIAKVMGRKLPYSKENQPQAHRLAEMFSAGIARLMEKFGKFEVPPETVIGRVAGRDMRFVDIEGLKAGTKEDRAADELTQEIEALRKTIARGTWSAERLAKAKLEPLDLTDSDLSALRQTLRAMEKGKFTERAIEHVAGEAFDRRAAAAKQLENAPRDEKGMRRLRAPFEDRSPDFDEDGDLTSAGLSRILESEGRTEVGKDENIRMAGTALETAELVNRSNMDGSANSQVRAPDDANLNGAVMASMSLRRANDAIGRKVGERLKKLLEVSQAFSAKDARALAALQGGMPASEVAAIINPLARKYAGAIVKPEGTAAEPNRKVTETTAEKFEAANKYLDAPAEKRTPDGVRKIVEWTKTKPRYAGMSELAARAEAMLKPAKRDAAASMEYLNNPPIDYTTEEAREILKWAREQPESAETEALIRKAEDVLEGDASLAEFEGGTPDPKTLAAQAAAGDQDAAYALTTKALSAQATGQSAKQTPADRAAVAAHITKVLGPKVKLEWANLTHAGEFERMKLHDVIRISVHALDPMSTGFHESLHGFFAQLRDAGATNVIAVLDKAASSSFVLDQLKSRFANEPAVLAQLKDPEERTAYMYQMWASDPTFRITPASKSAMRKIADFIRKLLGVWANDERALHIMGYFHSGQYASTKPSAARAAMMLPGRNKALDTAKTLTEPAVRLAEAVAATGSGRLRDTEIPALVTLADVIKREHIDARGGDRGFIPAAREARTRRLNTLGKVLSAYSEEVLDDARDALQADTQAKTPEARLAVRAIKEVLAETREYMLKSGVKVGDMGDSYFPRVWDTHFISKNQQAFRDMLEPHVRSGAFKGNVDDFIRELTTREGNEFGIETRHPGMQFSKGRKLSFITPAEAAPFLSKSLLGTLSSYVTQATRKAEWERRLGGGKLETLLGDAKAQGATTDQLLLAERYLKGVDGTLGDDINPHMRRLIGNAIVYQNIRLLPLAVFSSIMDPVGIMVRGGTVADAWGAFKRGMKEIPQSYGRAVTNDRSSDAAELIGVIDSAILTSVMGDLYTQGMVGGTAQKINSAFFKYNMMEGLNRSFRIGATEAAMKFIVRHSSGAYPHSARWMAELGLRPGDVKVMPDGRPALTVAEGLSAMQERRVRAALNQWVDGAVLRPDAADKPIWMNDPRWALVSHLKQFVYSFQKVILGRVAHEVENGNFAPVMALAAYVPVMMAADFAKGTLQGGGDQPEWKRGWEMSDYVTYGVERAGLLGVGQFGVDAMSDVQRGGVGLGALAGPTIEQMADVVQMLGGQKQVGSVVLDAMPANALYSELARSGGASTD